MIELPTGWTKFKPQATQQELWRTKKRFVCVCAGRGSGKTELARRRLVRYLPVKKPWDDPKYFYAGPTYGQVKRIAWDRLRSLIPKGWIRQELSGDLVIKTVFGSELWLLGLDSPQRFEGVQWDGGVVDESSDVAPRAFDLSIRPALTERRAWCWRIGVPKRQGIGAAEFRQRYFDYLKSDDPTTGSYHWSGEDILDPQEIEDLKRQLDEKDYNEQVRGNWESMGGLCFYSFGEHNIGVCNYDPTRIIYVGSDFNVNPMCWVLCHVYGEGKDKVVKQFDEIWLRDTNTPGALTHLVSRYGHHEAGWVFTGDATGRARKTSATVSDYLHIKNCDALERKLVVYPKSNPGVKNRLSVCNSVFKNALGEVRYFVDASCTKTIDDLNVRGLGRDGSPDDSHPDIGHITDALGYLLYRLFPLRINKDAEHSQEVTINA